jgi:aspartate/methionine/tyrosine aminotransferase
MSFDLQMVRTHDENAFNLSVGEPFFLHSFQPALDATEETGLTAKLPLLYPAFAGEADLLKLLRAMYPGKHVVVANGAKQALLAAIHAIKVDRPCVTKLFHTYPYWPSYPTLARMSGLAFESDWQVGHRASDPKYITINTAPNNPDGFEGQVATRDLGRCLRLAPLRLVWIGPSPSNRDL